MPAKSSMTGLRIFLTLLLAISARYIATAIPKGNASKIAPRLTQRVPSNNGSNPNWDAGVAVGNHSLPVKYSFRVIVSAGSTRPINLISINCSGKKPKAPGSF